MANPITTADLYKDTGELKKLISELGDVQNKLEELRKSEVVSAARLAKELKGLSVATSSQRDAIEGASKQTEEIAKRYDKYNESLNENAVKIAALKNAQRQANQLNKLEAKLITEKEGSYNKLSAQYSVNKIRLNQLSTEERKNTKAGQELVKTTNEIFQEMKKLQAETGKTSLNVGNYADATKGLIAELDNLPGVLGSVSSGVKGVGAQFKALLANPIVLLVATLAGALITLTRAFGRSEKGAELMAKATGFINGLMSQLVDIAVKVAEAVEFAFSNPKEAIVGLGKSLVTNILNRFKGVAIAAFNTGKAIAEAFKGNFEAAEKAAKDAVQGIAQVITGLDATQQNDLARAVKEATEEIVKETSAFIALEQAKKGVRTANRALIRSIERLTTVEELNNVVADDTTKSFKEREEAAERARIALEARAAKEIQLAKSNLALLNTEITLRRANGEQIEDLLDRQLEAYREVEAAERQLTIATAQNEKTRSELKQDRLERDLDILIDGFDNQKTINERLIDDDRKTFLERQRLFRATTILAQGSFAKQIETIQKFTGVQIDANELLAESDAVVLNEKIRSLGLSEIIEGRILEVIRERRIVNQDLADIERELIELREKNLALQQTPLSGFERQLTEEAKADLEEIRGIVQSITTLPDEVPDGPTDLYSLFGLSVGDEEKKALSDATNFAISQVQALAQARTEAANQAVEAKNREVDEAQTNLQTIAQLAELGFAVSVENAQNELDLAKRSQEEALAQQRKAQREQRLLDTLQQTSSLITAAAKIFATVNFPFSLIAVGTMFGAFALSKIKAAQATREFRGGDYTVLSGPKHSGKGTGIPLGVAADGVAEYAEGGEGRAIFSAKAVSKYGGEIESVVRQFNSLNYERRSLSVQPINVNSSVVDIDTTGMNENLSAMRRNSETTYYTRNGNLVEKYKNRTRTYVN